MLPEKSPPFTYGNTSAQRGRFAAARSWVFVKAAQALCKGDQENERCGSDWYRPQGANPAPAYADARDDAVLRGQPVAHGNAVVRRTQRRRDGTVRRQSDLDRVRHKLGLPLNPDPGMCSNALT